ncbi:MAG: nucleotidyltransferase family protein [Conexivisphaera sp.]
MRAIVLAGGFARRMWPLTANTPKQLLPLADGYVILDLVVDGLLGMDLDEILLSVNARFSGDFRRWMESRGLGLRIVEEGATREEEKPGAVGALAAMLGSLARDDYLIVAGDNVTSVNYPELVGVMRSRGSPAIALYDVGSLELARRYGVVEVGPDWRVLSLVEKPPSPGSTLISTAIYALPWGSLRRVSDYVAGGRPRDAIGHFVSWLISIEPVYGFRFNGYWFDVGSIDEYERVRELFAQGVIPRPRYVGPRISRER